MKFCILLLLSFLSFSLSKNLKFLQGESSFRDMENIPQLLQLVSNLVRLYHHIHYLPNQKETQIDLLLKNEAQLLKDNDASLSFQKRIDIYSACQWEQKFPRKHRVDEGFIYNFVTFMSDAMYIERKRNPDMWSGMEMLFNGGNSDKLKYIIMFTNRNKEGDIFDVFAVEVAPGVAVTSEKFIVNKMVEGIRGRTDVTESSDVLKEYPERFTNSDVENLFRLFRKIAIRATAEKFGLKL